LGQQALGVAPDGRVGAVTRAAFTAAMADPVALLNKYTAQKAAFYQALHQPRFLKGWLSRNRQVHDAAMQMITGAA
jgi:lysozyme family protein